MRIQRIRVSAVHGYPRITLPSDSQLELQGAPSCQVKLSSNHCFRNRYCDSLSVPTLKNCPQNGVKTPTLMPLVDRFPNPKFILHDRLSVLTRTWCAFTAWLLEGSRPTVTFSNPKMRRS